jgi:hypothetical protein
VPPGYSDPAMFKGGSPYGATATTGAGGPARTTWPRAAPGQAVATVAEWVRHAKSHAHSH